MLFDQVLARFAKDGPLSVMVQGTLENIFHPEAINALFEQTAQRQYTRHLLFSSVVDTMTLVACGIYKTPHAVYKDHPDWFTVSVTSLYNKLAGVEPAVSAELVRYAANRIGDVIRALGAELPALLPGYPVKILDGNALAATEHRLKELRPSSAAPLPGKSLVVLDLTVEELAAVLCQLAQQVNLARYRKHTRGVKKPPPTRHYDPKHPHVSTAKVLDQRKQLKRSAQR